MKTHKTCKYCKLTKERNLFFNRRSVCFDCKDYFYKEQYKGSRIGQLERKKRQYKKRFRLFVFNIKKVVNKKSAKVKLGRIGKKLCKTCNIIKDLSDFSHNKNGYLGRHSKCKECSNKN